MLCTSTISSVTADVICIFNLHKATMHSAEYVHGSTQKLFIYIHYQNKQHPLHNFV